MKNLDVLAVIHYGNYLDEGNGISRVLDDNCPCCGWTPPEQKKESVSNNFDTTDRDCVLGTIWNPKTGKAGMGCLFQVFHCDNCGIVYATHLN